MRHLDKAEVEQVSGGFLGGLLGSSVGTIVGVTTGLFSVAGATGLALGAMLLKDKGKKLADKLHHK